MSFFFKKVDMRKKQEMVELLANHFRYHTNNSWNASTSYANKVKVQALGLTREQRDHAYALLDIEELYDTLHMLMLDWQEQHPEFEVGFNGRSSGYVVLYRHGHPGLDIDMGEDFSTWDMDSLRSQVKLVQAFDQLCDDMRCALIDFCDNYEVVEEVVMVPHTLKKLVEVRQG